jgi:hypothetical protein
MRVRPGAIARGAGVALACLVSGPTARTNALFAAYAVGWPLDKPGLQVLVWVPETDEPWKRAAMPFATSVTSWSTVMFLATTAVRRTAVPAPIAAVLLGAAVAVGDSFLADVAERAKAEPVEPAEAAAAVRDSAEPETP